MGKEREHVPNKLRWYRELKDLSQKDVAVILQLKNSCMISEWENDVVRPNLDYVLKLSHLYSTLPGELFCDLSDRHRDEITAAFKRHVENKEEKQAFYDDS